PGSYTLLVEGYFGDTGSGTYTFNAQPVIDPAPVALTLGSLVSGKVNVAGETERYAFTLAAPARLYLDRLTGRNPHFTWPLAGPAGTAVNAQSFLYSDWYSSNPVLSLPAGSYTLAVRSSADTTGSYQFRLSDLATAAAITPGTPVSGTLNPADATNLY